MKNNYKSLVHIVDSATDGIKVGYVWELRHVLGDEGFSANVMVVIVEDIYSASSRQPVAEARNGPKPIDPSEFRVTLPCASLRTLGLAN